MYLFSVINTLADLAMFWLLMSVSKTEDRAHPLAAYVTITAAPYCAHLYPMIMRSATFGMNVVNDPHMLPNMQAYSLMMIRDRSFESIMLATTFFVILIGGACSVEGIVRSFRQDKPLSACQVRRRIILPLCLGLFLTMAIYNNIITIHHSHIKILHSPPTDQIPNIPLFCVFVSATACLLISLIIGSMKMRNVSGEISEHRQHMHRCFTSLRTFFMVSSVPIFYIIYQLVPQENYHFKFWFSDMENFIRFIFLGAILILEPYASRLQFRQSFYRTGISENGNRQETRRDTKQEVEKENANKVQQPQAPPASAPAPPPSYEVAAQQMSWSTNPISELDVNFKKTPLTPIESA